MADRPRLGVLGVTLAAFAVGGCGVAPTSKELTQADAWPFAGPADVVGDYAAVADGQPWVSLVELLENAENDNPSSTMPADAGGVHVSTLDGRLTVRKIGDRSPRITTQLPIAFKNGYFRGDYSGTRPATPCVPAVYRVEEVAVGRRVSDDALVVMAKNKSWMIFPVPFSGGLNGPSVSVFPRHRPATVPADAD